MAKSFEEARTEAVQGTYLYPSVPILEAMPRLVAAPTHSGHADLCYQDADILGATCCTQTEACLLYWVAGALAPQAKVLEIGSYIGWSTAHLLYAGQAVTVIEPFLEHGRIDAQLPTVSSAAARQRFWVNLDSYTMRSHRAGITLIEGCSPEDIPEVGGGWDFAFVDGWHLDGQPLRDVQGVVPLMAPGGVLALHDLWIPDVQAAARWLIEQGWHLAMLDTANYLTFAWRTEPVWWERVGKLASAPAFFHAGAARHRLLRGIVALDELQESVHER